MGDINALILAIGNLVTAMANPSIAPAGPAAPPAPPKISVHIPIFKGDPQENVVAWTLQVVTIFAAQGIVDNATKVYYASTGLKEAALHWYLNKTLENNGQPPYNNFDVFSAAIKAAFQPPNFQSYLRQQLKRTKQTGTVQEYTSRFQNIIGQVEGMGELDKAIYYMDGLKNATRMEVSYRAPTTLATAIEHAIKYDTAMYGLGKPKGQTSYQHTPQFTPDTSTPMELDSTEVNRQRFHKKDRKLFTGNCFICGKQGHISRDCKDRAQPKVSSIEETIQLPGNYNIQSDNTNTSQQLLTLQGKINGHEAHILLDSGASRNFINTKFVKGTTW